MTVGTAEKMWSKDNLRHSSQDGRKETVDLTVGYSVTMDATDPIEAVLSADGLPRLGDTYSDYPQIRVVDVDPQRISPVYAVVMVRYKGESATVSFGSDPIDIPPLVDWDNSFSEEEWDKAFDAAGSVCSLATANDERVHGITERLVDFIAIIERNYAYGAFSLSAIHAYLHSVNSDPIVTKFGIFGPGTARLTRFKPREAYADGFGGYVKVNAEVTFRYPYQTTAERAWWKRYLHEGYIIRVQDADNPNDRTKDRFVNAVEKNRDRTIKPILLDAEGFALPPTTIEPGENGEILVSDTPPFYREQRTLLELPYSVLGLF